MTNVLLSCVGRQSDLVRWFVEATASTPRRIYAIDADPNAPALRCAHNSLAGQEFGAPNHADFLLSHCQALDVSLVVTLHEGELAILETARERFQQAGVFLVGSPKLDVQTFTDKMKLHDSLRDAGLPVPYTWLASSLSLEECSNRLPLFVKPRRGRGSRGAAPVRTLAELEDVLGRSEGDELLIQEFVEGEEFGLDVINNLNGAHCATLVRRKLRMRYGETDLAVSVRNAVLEALGSSLGAWTQHFGSFDVDVMWAQEAGPQIIDINPRFGGGYAFSHKAGANVPAALIRWLANDDSNDIVNSMLSPRPGLVSERETRVIAIREDMTYKNGSTWATDGT